MGKVVLVDKDLGEYWFHCPGCGCSHRFWTKSPEHPNWSFNGDLERPTISPSHRVRGGDKSGPTTCHSFIKDGKIEFLNDCTHHLKGKTVDMVDFK